MEPQLRIAGVYEAACLDEEGSLVWSECVRNGITTVGLNHLLGVTFNAVAQAASWFGGLIDNTGFSALAAADTMSSHSGWAETAAYSQATRAQWTPLSVSGGAVTNTSRMQFTANATVTVRGFFLTSGSAKGGTTGTLFSTATLSASRQLFSGQILQITYTLRAAQG